MIIKFNQFLTHNHSSSNDFLFLTTTNKSSIEFMEIILNLNFSLYYYHFPFKNEDPTFTKLIISSPFNKFHCISFNTLTDNFFLKKFENNYLNFINSIKSISNFRKFPF